MGFIGTHAGAWPLRICWTPAGYGIAEVAERLGHDPATLMRYYARVNADRHQSADDLAGLIAPDFTPIAEVLSAA
ncbi:hypothetical protein GCM10009827_081520 [Dactylosporangium maewongense]|uniref:Tyr recombinase domain-containing protein n=1 Tax=Dactylosporangium maewongense TaxID=634393 RepID=A0ABN2BWV6_9ACTN